MLDMTRQRAPLLSLQGAWQQLSWHNKIHRAFSQLHTKAKYERIGYSESSGICNPVPDNRESTPNACPRDTVHYKFWLCQQNYTRKSPASPSIIGQSSTDFTRRCLRGSLVARELTNRKTMVLMVSQWLVRRSIKSREIERLRLGNLERAENFPVTRVYKRANLSARLTRNE